MKKLLFLLISILIVLQLIIAQENISENQTDTNISLNNITETNVSDNQPPTLIISSPSGKIDSLTPEISISVNDSERNLESCWYNVLRASNAVQEINFRRISDCKKEIIPEGFLQNNLNYIINVSANDTYGNIVSLTSSFTTPEIKIPVPPAQTTINNINQTNINQTENKKFFIIQLFIDIFIDIKKIIGSIFGFNAQLILIL